MNLKFLSQKLWILLGVLILIIGGVGLWKYKAQGIPPFREAIVTRGDIHVIITATGTVSPENRLEIKPPIAGRVEDVKVNEGETVEKGQLLAWMSSSERAALLDAAQARGPDELKRWKEFYRPTPILSPIHGTIILRNVEPGQSFTTQEAILVISDRLTVKAQVDETDIGTIKLGQAADISLDAYPKKSFSAVVDQIAFDAKNVNNVTTYVVDVLPKNPPDFLRSGMTASVNFETASHTNVLTLPLEAIRTSEGHSRVLLRSEKSKIPTPHDVTLGLDDGQKAEIISGLSEGDLVLIPPKKLSNSATKTTSPFSPMGHPSGSRK